MIVEVPFALIIALSVVNGSAVVALIGVVVYLALRVGRLPTHEDHNESRAELRGDIAESRREHREDMAELRAEVKRDIAGLRADMREDMAQLRVDMREEMAQLRADMREDMAQLREEFRRSHQQIMLALVNHSHRDDGQAMFTLPPETEIAPTPADD